MSAAPPPPSELTPAQTLARLDRAFATCARCGRREQLDLLSMRMIGRFPWTMIAPRLRCRAPRDAADGQACAGKVARLEVIHRAFGREETRLELRYAVPVVGTLGEAGAVACRRGAAAEDRP